jgi:hypothetical protein
MKPMAFNLKDAKKISGDKHHSIFEIKGGHQIKVAHAPLSALHRKQLESMPVQKMADGGDVNSVSGLSDQDYLDQIQASRAKGSAIADKIGSGISNAASWLVTGHVPTQDTAGQTPPNRSPSSDNEDQGPDQTPSSQASPISAQADLKQPNNSIGSNFNFPAAYQQGQQAISEQQNIDAAKAKADADVQSKDLLDRQDLNQKLQDNLSNFSSQQKQFMQDYANGHIDPNHYLENMGAGQKIATAIGMLLGGASSHVTGTNPAADFLNKQIERDISAQREGLEQKKTLLGANQALFRDNLTAENQTRINMNDIYDHQIQLAASKLGTPQAKANADAAHSKFAMENAQLLQQNAMRATVMGHLQQGGSGVNAIDLANAGIIPQQEAIKEQASLDAQKTAIAKTQELYNSLNKEQTTGNILNPESSRRVTALNAELVNAVMNASASKRLTRESVEAEIAPLEIKTTDNQETRNAKQQGLMNIIQRHADPTPYMSHYAPGALPQYAQSSAPQTATMNGRQYQKVQGGWKLVQ